MTERPPRPPAPSGTPAPRQCPGEPGAPPPAAACITAAAAVAAGLAHAGSLASESTLRLYYLAAASQASGRLTIETGPVTFALGFRRGQVEHASSTAAEDDVGRFLVERGALAAEHLAAAARAGGDLVVTLVSLRHLDAASAYPLLQEHGCAVLRRALGVEEGRYRWEPGVPPPSSSFPLGARWGLLCDAVRRLDGVVARRRLGARALRAASRSGGRVALEDLRLTPQEARACNLFDGSRSVAEIAAAIADPDTLHRLALLLAETELVAFGPERPPPVAAAAPAAAARAAATAPDRPPRSAPARPRPSPQRTAPPASAPTGAPQRPDDPAALRAVRDRLAGADHFEALGVSRSGPATRIKAAYFQLAKQYHPDAAPAGSPEEARSLRAEIFARLSEAWAVLEDDARREAYAQSLERGDTTAASEVDVTAILKAEQAFHTTTALVKTRRYREALAAIDEAIELNAEEPEFRIWKAWVQFLVGEDRKAQRAASAVVIEKALAANPRCIPGYLFLAMMAKLVGDVAAAERHLGRGLELEPQHADLLRELRYLHR